eukprot:scaffold36758_cov54-Phaeocystis_antarctica.AAC.2
MALLTYYDTTYHGATHLLWHYLLWHYLLWQLAGDAALASTPTLTSDPNPNPYSSPLFCLNPNPDL